MKNYFAILKFPSKNIIEGKRRYEETEEKIEQESIKTSKTE